MVGDKEQKNPGIMPRSFNAIFDMIQENSNKFDFKVTYTILLMQLLFLNYLGDGKDLRFNFLVSLNFLHLCPCPSPPS